MVPRRPSRPTRRALLAAAGGAAVLAASPAVATAAPDSVLQVNACDSGLASCYTGRAPASLPVLIRARKAGAVTLNEVCSTTVRGIARATRHRYVFSSSGTQKCAKGRGAYGNAILVPAGRTLSPARRWTYDAQQDGAEKRTLMCAVSSGHNVCVTHLDSKGLQATQGAQLRSLLVGLDAERPTILGGDLNLKAVDPAQAVVPAGMFRKGDGGVMHVIASQRLGFSKVRTMDLSWTDHPALQVSFGR